MNIFSSLFNKKNDVEKSSEILEISSNSLLSTSIFGGKKSNLKTITIKDAADDLDKSFAMDENLKNFGGAGNSLTFDMNNLLAWYYNQFFIGYSACGFIAQHWLVDKACTMPGQDAVAVGYDLTTIDGNDLDAEVLEKLYTADTEMGITSKLASFDRGRRVFGQMFAMAVFDSASDDENWLEKPFNADNIKPNSYKGMNLIEPRWCAPVVMGDAVADPTSINFYEPEFWLIGNKKIHKSHLIRITTGDVSDQLKPSYRYGGVPLTQRIFERVYAAERTANEAPALAMTKRTDILKVDLTAAQAQECDFEQNLEYFVKYRDNYGIKVIGQDDDVQRLDTSLADFEALIMTQYRLVASISGLPEDKIMEKTTAGLSNTGQFQSKSYIQDLIHVQNSTMQFMDRHHECLVKSEIPELKDAKVKTIWLALDGESEKEKAEINEINSRTEATYIQAGVVASEEVRNRIKADRKSSYMLSDDFDADIEEEESNPFESEGDDTFK